MEDFLILRNLEAPVPENTSADAAERADRVLEELNDEGGSAFDG